MLLVQIIVVICLSFAAMWERQLPDLPDGWQRWHRRGATATVCSAAVDTATAAAEEDAWAYYFSRPQKMNSTACGSTCLNSNVSRTKGATKKTSLASTCPRWIRRRTENATARGHITIGTFSGSTVAASTQCPFCGITTLVVVAIKFTSIGDVRDIIN